MHFSFLSTAIAITLASPAFAQGRPWIMPAAGQVGKITDPTRVYCFNDDNHLEATGDCTAFTSDGKGGLQSPNGWLQVNEETRLLEIVPGDAPAFRWQGHPRIDGSPAEDLSWFAADDQAPRHGPIWNHVPGENTVAVWAGQGQEAPLVLSFVTNGV